MRDYCRVYHTSMDYLTGMPMARLIDELQEAAEELDEERRAREKQLEKERSQMKSRLRRR